MGVILKHKINTEALKYTSAIAELKLLVNMPSTENNSQKIRQAVAILKSNLKYLKARRLQLVHNNLVLRKSIDNKIKHMTRQERRLFIRQLRAQPRKVLELFGAGEVLNTMSNENSGLFEVMIAYLKMLQRESREDRQLSRESREIELISASEKITQDAKKIEEGMKEAEEKARQAMQAATTELVISLVAGVIQIVESIPSTGGGDASSPDKSSATDVIDTSTYNECTNRAAANLESCQHRCPPGVAGNSCRSLCYATYLADIAKCTAGG